MVQALHLGRSRPCVDVVLGAWAPAGFRRGRSGPDERSRVGSQFGPYRLRRLMGHGGIGEVYEAEDTVNDRIVALKLFPYFPKGAKYRSWLERQANSVAQLSEPHTVPIHGFGE